MHDALFRLLFLLHVGATWYMIGIIWFVQVVHYPLFARVGHLEFRQYEQHHTAMTTWVVAPPMLVEAITAVLLCWFRPSDIAAWHVWLGMTLLVVIWLSTAFLQVPCHNMLSEGFDTDVYQRLVATNWIRTVAWSVRGFLVVWMALGVQRISLSMSQ